MTRSFHHGAQLGERHCARKMEAAAIRQDEQLVRGHYLERLANSLGDNVRRLDSLRLHVNHAEAQLEGRREFSEEIQILAAAPREFERELLHVRFQYARK